MTDTPTYWRCEGCDLIKTPDMLVGWLHNHDEDETREHDRPGVFRMVPVTVEESS